MAEERLAFESLPATVGSVLEGEPFTLDDEDSSHFQRGTWLHKAYPHGYVPEFPETLVEGFHLLSMLDAVARSANGHPDNMWALNYGLDRVRFIRMVHRGDVILPRLETLEVTPKGSGYKVLRRITFTVEGTDTPALVADWWSYVLPRGVEIS
ncbi:MaoC/PaaZ C-terminal domain-containing protein [Amycolatopsis pithecellobii]|nr:MaoC/PaaZ C-terminal domain-containing protein [Amycolatopsis pithecellobii]